MSLRTGLPRYRWSGGIAPGLISPLKRLPMTRSLPLESARGTRELAEVVAGVGVGHEDVFAAGGFDAGDEGRRSRGVEQ